MSIPEALKLMSKIVGTALDPRCFDALEAAVT
jgi:HD-GYP domain-containing protein (c-di-GMP phosphodiesterase class II)